LILIDLFHFCVELKVNEDNSVVKILEKIRQNMMNLIYYIANLMDIYPELDLRALFIICFETYQMIPLNYRVYKLPVRNYRFKIEEYTSYFSFVSEKTGNQGHAPDPNEEVLTKNGGKLQSFKVNKAPTTPTGQPADPPAMPDENPESHHFKELRRKVEANPNSETMAEFMSCCFKDYLLKNSLQIHDVYN
jgi:hypothetical protein